MPDSIHLIWLSEDTAAPAWPLGLVFPAKPSPAAVWDACAALLAASPAAEDLCLFWCADLHLPDLATLQNAASLPGDCWHAGLRLGTAGLPILMDFVDPGWMLTRDPSPEIVATSWRISLSACLMRIHLINRFGPINPGFASLDTASLEWGHRLLCRGALVRHVPWLVPAALRPPGRIPLIDELRFLHLRKGSKWTAYAALRAMMTGAANPLALIQALRRSRSIAQVQQNPLSRVTQTQVAAQLPPDASKVTVLIPTIERYPYLFKLLDQLRSQTVSPLEVIVVDQTPDPSKDLAFENRFPGLPLTVIRQSASGQSLARNAGLAASTGEYILFIDDDDEVEPDLIERHLISMASHRCEVSCGVAEEAGTGPLPENFTFLRVSDVFPTNNGMVRRSTLLRSGLFDHAFDKGARADFDLGMRLYLSGALMVLNPSITVFHHHAPRGGLRTHKARVITYSSSRRVLWHRHLPEPTELYIAARYGTPLQAREALLQRVLGTFATRGSLVRRIAKLVIATFQLPHTLLEVKRRSRRARQLLTDFPQIPELAQTPLQADPVELHR